MSDDRSSDIQNFEVIRGKSKSYETNDCQGLRRVGIYRDLILSDQYCLSFPVISLTQVYNPSYENLGASCVSEFSIVCKVEW
jgi:hypothetical protein